MEAPRLDRGPGEDPGRQVIVTPGKIDIPRLTHLAPQSAYGVTVTVSIGTITPQK
jgi:hypothetical protein